MEKVYVETRTSPSDMAITFEVNGESVSLYIPMNKVQAMTNQQFVEMLANPLACSIGCSRKAGFAACFARCLYGDGKCCDSGSTNCD